MAGTKAAHVEERRVEKELDRDPEIRMGWSQAPVRLLVWGQKLVGMGAKTMAQMSSCR